MGKRKSKKIAYTVRFILITISLFLYFYIISNLLFASYTFLNIRKYSNYFLVSSLLISIIPSILIGLYTAKHYKKWVRLIDTTKGLLVAIPIIVVFLFTISISYNKIRINKIYSNNERIFENYEKYIDFNKYEYGYNYRLDNNTNTLYYMEEHNLIAIEPKYFYDLNKNSEFKIYKLDNGFLFENAGKIFITKKLEMTSEIYEIKAPAVKIKREIQEELYYILENDIYKTINEDYKSEQFENLLYLYKKYNDLFYTKEKMYDLRIQVLNEFISSQEAVYNKRDIIIPIQNKKYKIIFTFNENLEVVYSKEEIQ